MSPLLDLPYSEDRQIGHSNSMVTPQLNHTNLNTEANYTFHSPNVLKSNKVIQVILLLG